MGKEDSISMASFTTSLFIVVVFLSLLPNTSAYLRYSSPRFPHPFPRRFSPPSRLHYKSPPSRRYFPLPPQKKHTTPPAPPTPYKKSPPPPPENNHTTPLAPPTPYKKTPPSPRFPGGPPINHVPNLPH